LINEDQSLVKDKFGNFHLSTVFKALCGEHVQHDVGVDTGDEAIDVVYSSLFMRAIGKIANSRI
jgi:hypothetical protein